jgi:hypothetical protein
VAVTSIWHFAVHEIEGWGDEEVGTWGEDEIDAGEDAEPDAGGDGEIDGWRDDAGVGTSVWTTVVVLGTTCVMVKICVTKIVETRVDAGTWDVITTGEPETVVVMVEPCNVTVLRIKLVTVLAGRVEMMVDVAPESVSVESTVDAGSCKVRV